MKFLDVKTDYAFKRVFGAQESAPILISFLNAVLEYEGEHRIVSPIKGKGSDPFIFIGHTMTSILFAYHNNCNG